MFRDNSLIPTEAIRLAALGLLSETPRHYGDLAIEIRRFTSHIAGPNLELMGTSLELLRLEGLIEAVDGKGMSDNATLRVTPAGQAVLHGLLQARLRAPLGDLNRLAFLLKLRFLHHLSEEEQRQQMAYIAESLAAELQRLDALRRDNASAPQVFLDWLDHDLATLRARLAAIASEAPRDAAQ